MNSGGHEKNAEITKRRSRSFGSGSVFMMATIMIRRALQRSVRQIRVTVGTIFNNFILYLVENSFYLRRYE